MTVVDTSAVIDLVFDPDAPTAPVAGMPANAAAPDVLVFEFLAVCRRDVRRGVMPVSRAESAIADLGDMSIELFPCLPLRERTWELQANLSPADALFVALAERLGEPLLTSDKRLAAAAREHASIETIEPGAGA